MSEELKLRVLDGLILGVTNGWWEDVDLDRLEPVPFAKVFKISDFPEHERTFAHLVVKLEIFPSVSQARKNGHTGPLTPGESWFKKRTVRVILK